MSKRARLMAMSMLIAALTVTAAAAGAANSSVLPVGELVERVRCENDPDISYALFLPPGYGETEGRDWPIIWCIDAGGKGNIPVQQLLPAAERYGYILVGAYNCWNGPWEQNDRAFTAMWSDVNRRFAVDGRRHYGIGLSGGSRMILDYAIWKRRHFAGVIQCGAVFSPRRKLPPSGQLVIVGMVGDGDSALAEHLRAEKMLSGFTQWQEVFPGSHHWPTKRLLTEAVELFEAVAMLRGQLPADDRFLRRVVHDRIAAAEQLAVPSWPCASTGKPEPCWPAWRVPKGPPSGPGNWSMIRRWCCSGPRSRCLSRSWQ